MHMQNGYLYELSEMTCHTSTKVSQLFDELSVACSSLSKSYHSATPRDVPIFYYKNVYCCSSTHYLNFIEATHFNLIQYLTYTML